MSWYPREDEPSLATGSSRGPWQGRLISGGERTLPTGVAVYGVTVNQRRVGTVTVGAWQRCRDAVGSVAVTRRVTHVFCTSDELSHGGPRGGCCESTLIAAPHASDQPSSTHAGSQKLDSLNKTHFFDAIYFRFGFSCRLFLRVFLGEDMEVKNIAKKERKNIDTFISFRRVKSDSYQ